MPPKAPRSPSGKSIALLSPRTVAVYSIVLRIYKIFVLAILAPYFLGDFMPRYVVHVYAVIRVPIKGVNAESPEEAVKKVDEEINLHEILDKGEVEYAEDVTEYLVDEVGDDGDIKRSFWLDRDGNLVKQL